MFRVEACISAVSPCELRPGRRSTRRGNRPGTCARRTRRTSCPKGALAEPTGLPRRCSLRRPGPGAVVAWFQHEGNEGVAIAPIAPSPFPRRHVPKSMPGRCREGRSSIHRSEAWTGAALRPARVTSWHTTKRRRTSNGIQAAACLPPARDGGNLCGRVAASPCSGAQLPPPRMAPAFVDS